MTPPKSVPREFYEEMKRRAEAAEKELAQYRLQYTKLVEQMVDLKRHDLGAVPRDWKPQDFDPMKAVGPLTAAAIDSEALDPEHRNYLRNFAIREIATRAGEEPAAVDKAVAERIKQGDTD